MGLEDKSDGILMKGLDHLPKEISYLQSNLVLSLLNLQNTKNEDFRLLLKLQELPSYINLEDAKLMKTSSYLSRFMEEINKNSVELTSAKAMPLVKNRLRENNVLTKETLKFLGIKLAKNLIRGI